jgi:outer membrane protein assembly factor BamB
MRARAIVVAACVLLLGGCDWPMFMANPAHTGISGDTSIGTADAPNLTEAWRANLGAFSQDVISSSPVVSNGVVYVGTSDGRVMAFDADAGTNCSGSAPKTCTPLWASPSTTQAITATPAVVNGVVYVGTQFGFVEGFDAAGNNGCGGAPKICFPIWESVQVGAIKSWPVVTGGKVYIGSDDTDLYAFNAAGSGCTNNCPIVSAYRTNGDVVSSPAVSNNVVYVGSDDGNLYAFDARGVQGCDVERQCEPLWIGPTGGAVRSSPSVAGGRVFVGSQDQKFYAFDAAGQPGCNGTPKTCTPLWTATLPGGTQSSPAVSKGVVYVASNTDGMVPARINAFDAAGVTNCSGSPRTCQPLWRSNTTSFFGQTPVSVVHGVVYVVLAVGLFSFVGDIYAFDEAAGSAHCSGTPKVCTPLWSAEPGDTGVLLSAVAVANGDVYAAGNQLHAFTKP